MSRKPYQPQMPRNWFLRHPFYKAYMVREATVVFMALYMLNLILGLCALVQGAEAWAGWLATQANPLMIAFSVVSMGMCLYHSLTWFAIAPKAVPPIFIGGKKLAPSVLVKGHWAAFAVVSVVVIACSLWGIQG